MVPSPHPISSTDAPSGIFAATKSESTRTRLLNTARPCARFSNDKAKEPCVSFSIYIFTLIRESHCPEWRFASRKSGDWFSQIAFLTNTKSKSVLSCPTNANCRVDAILSLVAQTEVFATKGGHSPASTLTRILIIPNVSPAADAQHAQKKRRENRLNAQKQPHGPEQNLPQPFVERPEAAGSPLPRNMCAPQKSSGKH